MTRPAQVGQIVGVTASLTGWLRSLDAERLARILGHRPDAAAPAPRSLRELAERLQWLTSAGSALQSLPLPATQLVEVILATEPPTRKAVADALRAAESALDEPLRALADRALVWPDGELLRVGVGLTEAIGWPLGLGMPIAELIAGVRADELKTLAATLGLPTSGRRADLQAAIIGWYAQPAQHPRSYAQGPQPARVLLSRAVLARSRVPSCPA